MAVILQNALPDEMLQPQALPGVSPCAADDWLRVDEAYAAQMAYRATLMAEKPDAVLWMSPAALPAAQEVLQEALGILPPLGFDVQRDHVICPDGRCVVLDGDDPLHTLGHLVQQDICVLEKRGAEHVLTAAIVCFPANWRLADKVDRPLSAIHDPVAEYDADLTRRVQRMFNGVRAGRPLWRFNRLSYVDADLHQPFRKASGDIEKFTRSERQCILRLPRTEAVVFTIHTHVVPKIG
ncbi:heme-dependent oxidative N-demethylase family protein [Sulfitobacter pacificus]|uniref:DUF3445 domain-containing protein n=1 Tax=Sulfitobacter pacificus TaxID=1499314 RepID=A0ABQ5VGI0_9RHOB|nr:DUF3445 domain-containing protein [Sulfitobacter pacificus]GLQ26210.1 hypothetical protein GCM10007927_10130 [Sulfitobacter pacificus]